MQPQSRFVRVRALAPALLAGFLAACQVLPPEHSALTPVGLVRAPTAAKAAEVARLLEALQPAVVAALPEARPRRIEVWVQETPALYRFAQRAYQDADGFFSESEDRIHLREDADSLERTLAHELVHAHLRGAWRALPGTLEEGVCDHLSGELCPDARARLRAGRLSCAAFALGGLALDLSLRLPAGSGPEGTTVAYQARLRLEGEPPMDVDPMEVFERQAGLSSSRLSGAHKKAYYGLAYLVVSRLVERIGLDGLHALCGGSGDDGRPRIATPVLLEAAGLASDPASWRAALEEEFRPADLVELVRGHPGFLVRALDDFLDQHGGAAGGLPGTPEGGGLLLGGPGGLEAELSLAGTDVRVELLSIPEVRLGLARLRGMPEAPALARR